MAPHLTRRQMLLGSAAALGAVGVAGGAVVGVTRLADLETDAPPPQRVPSPVRAQGRVEDAVAQSEWVPSVARGRSIRLVTVVPPGVTRVGLPVVVGLHGLRGNAQWWADPGTRRILGRAWARGVPPFAIVAVDGGDNYWHPYRPADDPLRMLLAEVPEWLRARGLGGPEGLPAAVAGVSMGGAGALLYARERSRAGRPVRAIAALSPGLFTDWRVASRRPFAGEADWVANDPMRFYPEIAGTPSGVWCGNNDLFVAATSRYIAMARPEIGSVTPGRHDGAYYSRILPEVFAFLGRHVRPTLPAALPPFRPAFTPLN